MSTKTKPAETETVMESTGTEVAEAEKTEVETTSPKASKKVKVMLPRDPLITGDGGDQEFFSVNGHNILVKTDEVVEVDEIFAEVIENKAKARKQAKKFIEQNKFKDSKPPTS